MKTLALLYALTLFSCNACTNSFCDKNLKLTNEKIEQFANAVYRIEGGKKARKPYGILTIPVKDEKEARQVCINTIKNNYKRWNAAGRTNCFIDFFADRYCPKSADFLGNSHWKKNAHAILK